MKIVWSEDALRDYHQNIDYLLLSWPVETVQKFINEVDWVLEILKISPKAFPLSDYKSARRAVIRKQITLFYRIEGDVIHLIRFWNTYQNPETINL
ncbi:MAG: type II toxin-antitoxin system RelE/ParE family toxin [Cyclobacteriaceae bacterium]|nr:type II toxin-antitoxin system RelE/ParE family toxin [Cyclobacteriaceae bacterium]